jgi:transcriptional regulator with XRE-family HTH domain
VIEPFYLLLGKRVRLAREAAGLSQTDLGLLLRPPMGRASIANIEAAKQRVLAHTVVQLGRALGATVSFLLTGAS